LRGAINYLPDTGISIENLEALKCLFQMIQLDSATKLKSEEVGHASSDLKEKVELIQPPM